MIYEKIKIPATLEKPYGEMSKQGAKDFFDWLNGFVDDRIDYFITFVEATSEERLKLNFSVDTLVPLGEWLQKKLQIRKRTEAEMNEIIAMVPDWLKESVKQNDTVLTEESISLCMDLAFYFSKLLMKTDSRITWKMHTKASKLDADRNQLILVGTSKIYRNPIRSFQIVGQRIAEGREDSKALLKYYEMSLEILFFSESN